MVETGEPTVSYINRYSNPNPGLRERIINALRRKPDYLRNQDQPFSTTIPLSAVDTFEDLRISNALMEQYECELTNSDMVIIPVVFAHRALSHVLAVPRKPFIDRDPSDT